MDSNMRHVKQCVTRPRRCGRVALIGALILSVVSCSAQEPTAKAQPSLGPEPVRIKIPVTENLARLVRIVASAEPSQRPPLRLVVADMETREISGLTVLVYLNLPESASTPAEKNRNFVGSFSVFGDSEGVPQTFMLDLGGVIRKLGPEKILEKDVPLVFTFAVRPDESEQHEQSKHAELGRVYIATGTDEVVSEAEQPK